MPAPKFTTTTWIIIIIASIGFLFDTYELLMTPLVAAPAISELLKIPQNNPLVTDWVGRLLWISALCGGTFGLMGGWLVDRFGRKKIMALSIAVYSFSPFFAAYATSLGMFVFFRSTTFIGVCVEFVAAITWLSEVFTDRHQKEKWLGITQAFASLGGVLVTSVSFWISAHGANLPHISLPVGVGATDPNAWRYLLMTGILPAIPILLLLPFVPESQIWKERRAAGTLKRPSFGALFAPELRRVTLVTAILSACAYGIAFGALQVTVARVTPGLPELKETSKAMAPLRKEGEALNLELNKLIDQKVSPTDPARKELVGKIKANFGKQKPYIDEVKKKADTVQFFQETGGLVGRILLACLLATLISKMPLTPGRLLQIGAGIFVACSLYIFFVSGNKLVLEIAARLGMAIRGELEATAATFLAAAAFAGVFLLLVLLITFLVPKTAKALLRVFQVPSIIVLPVTYFVFFKSGGDSFVWAYSLCGLLTVAQFSYFGEYLPKVFPLHLRGTGGSFATNVGGRMIGTSMAFVTTSFVAPMLAGKGPLLPSHVALAAGYVATTIAVISFIVGFMLPEPKKEE